MGMVQGLGFSRGLEKTGFWFLRFLLFSVSPDSGFELTAKNQRNPDKAVTRISNFSVARECKDPPVGGGPKGPPPLGDHLHTLSNTREIRNSSDSLVWIFCFFEVSSKPESGETENNRNRRNRKPRFSTRRRNRLQPNRTGAFLN